MSQYFRMSLPYGTVLKFKTISKTNTNDNAKTIYVRKQGTSNWTSYTSSLAGTTIWTHSGVSSIPENIELKGNNYSYGTDEDNYVKFESNVNNIKLYGNILSLIYGDNYDDDQYLALPYSFYRLFEGTGISVINLSPSLPPADLDYCYAGMFKDNTSLSTIQLPDFQNGLAEGSCSEMFAGCTSISYIENLVIDYSGYRIPNYCFFRMFAGCTSINIKYITIFGDHGESSCAFMFQNCTSLINPVITILSSRQSVTAPSLSAGCFSNMFDGCSSLTTTPTLPATTLANTCYYQMFRNCISLKTPPALPATTLADYCYYHMFDGCSSLTTTPTLPATTLANHCYNGMFVRCTKLTTAPALPATTLANNCYSSMFSGTSITTAPALPATTLANNCYRSMFSGCTKLTTAPQVLYATTLTTSCYSSMFYECTSLTTPPRLPSTTLASSCYSSMFEECTSLTSAPTLPATTLASNCYNSMFKGCTSLVTAPQLPSTTLITSCYNSMFEGCTSLATAPELPATTLVSNCYKRMFYNCGNINDIKAQFITTPGSSYTDDWLHGVAAIGNFTKNLLATWNVRGDDGIPTDWIVSVGEAYFCIISLDDNNTIKFYTTDSSYTKTIEVSTDTSTWTSYTSSNSDRGTTIGVLNTGDILYIRGENTSYCNGTNYHKFKITGRFNIAGYLMTLVNKYVSLVSDNCDDYAFTAMFDGCTSLVDASSLILPRNSVGIFAFASFFQQCTSLTDAPQLYATSLAESCYYNMFRSCTSLTTAPALPSTTLSKNCYNDMFRGCTLLVNSPELPAYFLIEGCYNGMFFGCTSLVTAPELPARTLVKDCYKNMFYGCIQLNYIKAAFITIPSDYYSLNFTYGVNSQGTFVQGQGATWSNRGTYACPTSWELVRPTDIIFCITSLSDSNIVSVYKTDTDGTQSLLYSTDVANWSSHTLQTSSTTLITLNENDKLYLKAELDNIYNLKIHPNGLYNVSGNIASLLYGENFNQIGDCPYIGSFFSNSYIKDASGLVLPWTTLSSNCYSGMFAYCTSLTAAPQLPATTLAISCYDSMFYDCSSLTTAPTLPATSTEPGCYAYMFWGCTSLTNAPELPALSVGEESYLCMFAYCTSLTVVPELPGTSLNENCYNSMFFRCTNLVTAPKLKALTAPESAYTGMFAYCYLISELTILTDKDPGDYFWNRLAPQGVLNVSLASTWVDNGSRVPPGWTVVRSGGSPFNNFNLYYADDNKVVHHISAVYLGSTQIPMTRL